ncbi:hypothetical protein F4677DRAFT_41863 [Hypoxylon crocopeplum]|nr:hypothetical protein F4677DRAFT_41863 [Hypoxylon crocopeplum]
MYSKTTAAFGLFAVSGAMAGTPMGHGAPAYPVNMTAPSPVWQYYNTTVPTTVVVPALTTVCHEHTTLTYNGVQYTATKGETVTVTNCPCTVTTAMAVMTSSACPAGVTPTAVAPAVSETTLTYPGTPIAPCDDECTAAPVGTPATVPAGAAPAVSYGNSPAQDSPATTTYGQASASYTASSTPTGIQIAGASSSTPGFAVALFAAFMGAVAL